MKEAFGLPSIDVTHVSNTNAFRADDGGNPDVFRERLLQEIRDAIAIAGTDEVAMIIAEPVQNAGGCLTPPPGYWIWLREIADEHGILLVADSVEVAHAHATQAEGGHGEGRVAERVGMH